MTKTPCHYLFTLRTTQDEWLRTRRKKLFTYTVYQYYTRKYSNVLDVNCFPFSSRHELPLLETVSVTVASSLPLCIFPSQSSFRPREARGLLTVENIPGFPYYLHGISLYFPPGWVFLRRGGLCLCSLSPFPSSFLSLVIKISQCC